MAKTKQKPAGKFNARDLLLKYQKEDIKETTGMEVVREKDIEIHDNYLKLQETIKEYNANITNLDEDYKALKPMRKVIVRAYLKEMKTTENGLLLPNVVLVKRQTQSGYGTVAGEIEVTAFSKKAIIVAVPANYAEYMKIGTEIYLSEDVIEASVMGTSQEAMVRIKNAFVHPEADLRQVPENPADKDFGYLAISYDDIAFIK